MPVIVVEVMPKAELLDPQGKAVAAALARLGRSGYLGVRVGKRFELEVEQVDDAAVEDARQVAAELLANGVIEDVVAVRPASTEQGA